MTIQTRACSTSFAALLVAVALAAPAGSQELDEARQAAVAVALQDEYQGRAIYARVLEDLGEVRPFSNVVHAEERHAAFLEDALQRRDLPVPEDRWAGAEVPTYTSRQEACEAAVEFEVHNVALYDRLLADDALPRDIRQAFEHNRMASLDHHKPAFERCAAGGGRGQGPAASSRTGGGGRCGRGRQARGCGGGGCGCGSCGGPGTGQRAGPGRCGQGGGPTASVPVESEW